MEYVPRTAKKKFITKDQTSPLEKNLNLITVEALTSKITFYLTKSSWIDYLMPYPSDRLDSLFLHLKMLIMSSNERF